MILLASVALAAPRSAWGQEAVPQIEQAEAIFQQALDAFEAEDYGMAYRRFRFVYDSYALNRKTTAAILMAGKALYRDGQYQRAIDLLSALVDSYPTSGYLAEAERTIALARRALGQSQVSPWQFGIALPLSARDESFTQSLFNGIRLAVEQHNRRSERPVRMVFRNTENTPVGARNAVIELAGGADVIFGPLYSEEAQAAALAAERAGAVLVAPLATDEEVSQGRTFVFQANPTIALRGQLMARRAVREQGLSRFGIAAEQGNAISERMAEGFQEEALRLGADVRFYELLPNARAWAELPTRVGEEVLREVEAVYLPISGRNAHQRIEAALDAFDRANVLPWVLGNSEYHDVSFTRQASSYSILYTDDFYVDDGSTAAQSFQRAYRALAGRDPDRLAYVGYDVTRFLLEALERADGQSLERVLREAPRYNGLGTRIDFREGNVNVALFFLQYLNETVVLQN